MPAGYKFLTIPPSQRAWQWVPGKNSAGWASQSLVTKVAETGRAPMTRSDFGPAADGPGSAGAGLGDSR